MSVSVLACLQARIESSHLTCNHALCEQVIDRTFDTMTQQTITNTTGYKMSKKDLYLLCPEIAPEQRHSYSKTPASFVDSCKASMDDSDAKAQEWLAGRKDKLADIQIAFGMRLQFQIGVDTDGGIEVMAPIRRLLVAETLVCVFEALTGLSLIHI